MNLDCLQDAGSCVGRMNNVADHIVRQLLWELLCELSQLVDAHFSEVLQDVPFVLVVKCDNTRRCEHCDRMPIGIDDLLRDDRHQDDFVVCETTPESDQLQCSFLMIDIENKLGDARPAAVLIVFEASGES